MKFEQYSNMSDKRKLEAIDKLVLNKEIWSNGTSFNDEEKLEYIGRILHQPMKKTDEEKLEAIKEIVDIYDMIELDYTSLGEDVKKIKKILDS